MEEKSKLLLVAAVCLIVGTAIGWLAANYNSPSGGSLFGTIFGWHESSWGDCCSEFYNNYTQCNRLAYCQWGGDTTGCIPRGGCTNCGQCEDQ